MSVLLPIGNSYFVPTNTSIVIQPNDLSAPGGALGPIILKIQNESDVNTAAVNWEAPVTPPTPEPTFFTNVNCQPYGQPYDGTLVVDVTVLEGVSVTVTNIVSSTPGSIGWQTDHYMYIDGIDIGGSAGEAYRVYFSITGIDPDPNTGTSIVTSVAYWQGPPPGFVEPVIPTQNNPTATVTIGPRQTELIQIPGSIQSPNFVPLTITAGGANVFVTPVQIVA